MKKKVSPDVKNLDTNVSVLEAIEITLRKLYATDYAPDIECSTLKMRLKLAVTYVYFTSSRKWKYQKDGLAMGACLAVFLAKSWMQSFEGVMKDEKDGLKQNHGIIKKPSENIKKQKTDCLEQLGCRT